MELLNLLLLWQNSVTRFSGLAFVKQVNNEACVDALCLQQASWRLSGCQHRLMLFNVLPGR